MAPSQVNNSQANGATNNATGSITLTTGDIKVLNCVFSKIPAKPRVDWGICAQELGFRNAHVARERFRQIVSKHHWFEASSSNPKDNGTDETAAVSPPSKKVKAARSAKRPRDSFEDDSAYSTDGGIKAPTKKRAHLSRKATSRRVAIDENDTEENTDVKNESETDWTI